MKLTINNIPRIVYLTGILIGVGLEYLWSLTFLPEALRFTVGPFVIILSFVLFGFALREFSRLSTSPEHAKETRAIISTGPFAYSRNPIYLSFTLLSIGIAITSGSIWIFAMTVPAIVVVYHFVILKEEQYMEKKFGDKYTKYKYSVRRWL
jgi:protein-S-isoprenylcysteine O-methyltransferase Ste14